MTIAENLPGPLRGASWSPQGVIVFSVNAPGPILRVSAPGGAISPATAFEKDKDSSVHRFPWFLPDGRHFLYISSQLGDILVRVGLLDEPDKPGKVVVQANSPALYSQGHLLYLRQNTLMAQPFDVQRLITTEEAVSIAERVYTVGCLPVLPCSRDKGNRIRKGSLYMALFQYLRLRPCGSELVRFPGFHFSVRPSNALRLAPTSPVGGAPFI